jgi:hypothetical protein
MVSPTADRRFGLIGNTPIKAPVTVLADSNITLSGEQTIDGVAVLASNARGVPDRVLCTGQTDATQNGIWDVSSSAWTRPPDANGNYDLVPGSTVQVVRGTTYAGSYWRIANTGLITIGTTSITWERALASSITTLSFLQEGLAAVSRGAQDKMRETVSLKDFGATGDGIESDSTALEAALAAHPGKVIVLTDPPVGWKFTQAHTIPTNTTLKGVSKQSTALIKAFNGDLFTLSTGAALEHLFIDGQGATYTGKLVKMLGTSSRQRINHCRLIEADDNCIYFEKDAGSQFSSLDLEAYRRNAGTGTGRYAVAVEDALASGAIPRKFIGFESGGTCSFSFGGAADFFVSESFLGDLAYSTNSRAVFIGQTRLANQAALTINGSNHTIVGSDINPQITLSINSDNIVIGPNSYNTLPIIDNSGNARNLLYSWTESFTCTASAAGGGFSLGDGSVQATFCRMGPQTKVLINFTVGSTTNLGAGALRFTLPQARHTTLIAVGGHALINDAGVLYEATCQIDGNVSFLHMYRDTSGDVTGTSPGTLATGDTVRIEMLYDN